MDRFGGVNGGGGERTPLLGQGVGFLHFFCLTTSVCYFLFQFSSLALFTCLFPRNCSEFKYFHSLLAFRSCVFFFFPLNSYAL